MEGTKLKNIVLLILVAVNVVLLAQIGYREHQGRQRDAELKAEIVELMSGNGVSLDPNQIPESVSLPVYTLERDMEKEKALAEALLGQVRRTDLGGNLHRYESKRGTGSFRSNGEFEITLTRGLTLNADQSSKDPYGALLEQMVFSPRELTVREEPGGGERVWAVQMLEGTAVFNCQVELECRNGTVWAVRGTYLMGQPAESGTQACSVLDGLLLFSNYIREQGQICKQINRIEAGYLLSRDGQNVDAVWCISTDVGEYYVNLTNKTVEST